MDRTSFQEEGRSYETHWYAGDRGFLRPSGNLAPWRAGAKDAGPRVGSRLGLVFGSGVVWGHFLEDG